LQGAELDDGGTVSGKFAIGPCGYLIAPIAVTTTAGTLLGGFSYAPSDPSDIVPNAPPAFGVDFFFAVVQSGSAHHLPELARIERTGPDRSGLIVRVCGLYLPRARHRQSWRADTRFFTAGEVVAAPEPASFGLLPPGVGAIGIIALRRRRASAHAQVDASGIECGDAKTGSEPAPAPPPI
jgi:hypothetical protein